MHPRLRKVEKVLSKEKYVVSAKGESEVCELFGHGLIETRVYYVTVHSYYSSQYCAHCDISRKLGREHRRLMVIPYSSLLSNAFLDGSQQGFRTVKTSLQMLQMSQFTPIIISKAIWAAFGADTSGSSLPSAYGSRCPDIAAKDSQYSSEMHSFSVLLGPWASPLLTFTAKICPWHV